MNRVKLAKIVATVAIVGGGLVYFVTSGLDGAMVYYKTVSELLDEQARFDGRPVRVNGVLVAGSMRQKPGTDQFRFQIAKQGRTLDVVYEGILPDAMQEDQELILHGVLRADTRLFSASEILTKCPSKYEAQAKALGP